MFRLGCGPSVIHTLPPAVSGVVNTEQLRRFIRSRDSDDNSHHQLRFSQRHGQRG